MDREQTMNGLVRDLLQWSIYKRTQGRWTRQVTAVAIGLVLALGAWRLSLQWVQYGPVFRYLVPGLVVLAGAWVAYRLVNIPRFADFLIAVEAEMNKVSWPSRGELLRSSVVVMVMIFALAVVLFAYDLIWRILLTALGVMS